MKVFIDANILVAVLNKEYPLYPYAAKLLSLSDRFGFELYTSPTCIAIAFYFASKKSGQKHAKKKITILLDHIRLTTVDENSTLKAIQNPKVQDLEDGIQYYSAEQSRCDFIVTENLSDFHFSEIQLSSCRNFLLNEVG
ncbi:type II toxin-antitoxin system VapC family toxin [Marinoscillum sp.]|uniref:type II toxin-antitoxin system VapC family toxin n=1 Tax=Marinoscillum sp. TaxID=2024838 RepID=UPI003BAC6973